MFLFLSRKQSTDQLLLNIDTRGLKGRSLVMGNKNKRIAKKRCDGEENVDYCERNWFLLTPTYQRGEHGLAFLELFWPVSHLK